MGIYLNIIKARQIFGNDLDLSDKELISKIYTELIQPYIQKKTLKIKDNIVNQLYSIKKKKTTEDLNRHFPKENTQMATGT